IHQTPRRPSPPRLSATTSLLRHYPQPGRQNGWDQSLASDVGYAESSLVLSAEPQRRTGPMKKLVYVGLDVHRDTIVIAVARSGREPAMQLGTIAHDELALIKRLEDLAPRSLLRVCYEAGPTGYDLARRLNEAGICCVVVAPSMVPVQHCRIKTDR